MSNLVDKADDLLRATDNYCKSRLELLSEGNPRTVTAHTRALDELRVARSEYAKARVSQIKGETHPNRNPVYIPPEGLMLQDEHVSVLVGIDGRPYWVNTIALQKSSEEKRAAYHNVSEEKRAAYNGSDGQHKTDREWGRPLPPRVDAWVPAAGGLSGVGVDGRPYTIPATVAPAAPDAPSDTPPSGTSRTIEMRVLMAIDADSGHCCHFSSGLSPERQLEQAKHALGDRILVWLTGSVVLNDKSGMNEVKGKVSPIGLE